MSTVEDLQSLVEQVNEPTMRSPMIDDLVAAYKKAGNSTISQIESAYIKIGTARRSQLHRVIACPYINPEGEQRDVIIYIIPDETGPEFMEKILEKEYKIQKPHCKPVDKFLRRSWLGQKVKPYRTVLKEIMDETKEAVVDVNSLPEHFFETRIPTSERI